MQSADRPASYFIKETNLSWLMVDTELKPYAIAGLMKYIFIIGIIKLHKKIKTWISEEYNWDERVFLY